MHVASKLNGEGVQQAVLSRAPLFRQEQGDSR
jgi:hypothetical protein